MLNRCFMLMLALTLSPLTSAFAADSGMKDSDRFLYSIVKTISKDQPEAAPAPYALCLLGLKADAATKKEYQLKTRPNAASHCDFLSWLTPNIEVVKEFPATEMKPAFWNSDARIPAPRQFSLFTEIPGSDFNQALARLEGKCASDCAKFELVAVHGYVGYGYSLPLVNFSRGPEASSVGYDEAKGSFNIDNVLMQVISR